MVVANCYMCDKDPVEASRYANTGLAEGEVCPVCYRPTCRHHMGVVRWRWRDETRKVGSALVCMECKTAYKHRHWDTIHRDWIS